MIDFDKSIIASLFECVDKVGADLVANTYHRLVETYAAFFWTMTAVYLGFLFLQAMQGRKSFYDLLNATFRTVMILTLIFNYQYFCLFIYDIVTKEPLEILKAVTIDGKTANPASISQALDDYLNLGLAYANKLFLMGSWSNLAYFIFALLVVVMTMIGALAAVGLILLSKCAVMVLLALSPLFIFLALFDMTKGLCESYLRHLITYALIPILTSIILMILFSVGKYVVDFMNQFPKATFKAIAPFLFMCGVQIYLLAQVFTKASALGAGFALGSLVSTLAKAKEGVKKSANVLTGGKLGRQVMGAMGNKALSAMKARMNRFRNLKS